MNITNLNIFSISIFIIIILSISFLLYKKYYTQINFNKKYELIASQKHFYIKYIFLFLSLFIILFSIFWIKYWNSKNNTDNNWIDTMFVLDVSKSMNVADITDWRYNYTRLDLAKKSISDYIIKNPQNRYWLVIFAWDAVSTIPLTTDKNLFLTMLSWVDYRNLTVQWSDFEKALNLATDRFVWDKDRSKSVIFISDWWDDWDNTDINLDKSKHISFAVIWIGSSKWWKIIKWQDFFWKPIYQKYKWKTVISKLNIDNLENIADNLDTNLIELKDVWDLSKVEKWFNKLEKKAYENNINSNLADFSRVLTIISFIFFVIFLSMFLVESRKNK